MVIQCMTKRINKSGFLVIKNRTPRHKQKPDANSIKSEFKYNAIEY